MNKVLVTVVAAIAAVLAFGPAAAQASGGCPGEPPSTQAFFGWDGDTDYYFLAPGGDFDAPGGWKVGDGAKVVSRPSGGVLALPDGGRAVSPPICVRDGYPHGRMYGAAFGSARASVNVSVVYDGVNAEESSRLKLRGGELRPTDRFSLDESAFGFDPITGNASIRLVLEGSGPGTALVDDVLIDPRARN